MSNVSPALPAPDQPDRLLLLDRNRGPRAILHPVGVAVWIVCLVLLFTGVLPHA